jgi:hypothetical protein
MADTSDAGKEPTEDDNQEHVECHEPVYEVPTSHDAKMESSDTEQPTDNALLQIAAAALSRESIYDDNDDMEDDHHGTKINQHPPALPPSSSDSSSSDLSSESSSSSSSSSSSTLSSGTHDTNDLMFKLRTNPCLPLINNLTSKKKAKNDELSGSQDSASHRLPGQDSGAVSDHLHTNTSGEASVTRVDAGVGD